MAFIEEINRAIAESMKAKDPARLVPLRMLKAALMNREVERGRALDENESRQVVSGAREAAPRFHRAIHQGGRQDLADKETAEITVLEGYLPAAVDAGGSRARASTRPSRPPARPRRKIWAA